MSIDSSRLADALDAVPDPLGGGGLVATGRAAPPRVADGIASVVVDATGLDDAGRVALDATITQALRAVPGVAGVRIAMSAERRRGPRLIAVASGKGGVGKSTLAANLAVAIARAGHSTGLVDADIYGPSLPLLMGTGTARPTAIDKTLQPIVAHGVKLLSIGMLVAPGKALAWRGPMASGALGQLIEADWGDAEILVIDLPPGTGDVQLSMIQKHRPAGAVIVSTPQDMALIDARRAADLFVTTNVPLLGLVENMAGYACPHCGELSDPFGHGGAEAAAAAMGLPFLGRIPLDATIRAASDAGTPPAAGDGPIADVYAGIAAAILSRL